MTNEQQQRAANAELARRMGWQDSEWLTLCFQEHHDLSDDAWCRQCNQDAHETPRVPPDYFNSPVASRELVVWLAADDARWFNFRLDLASVLARLGQWPEEWPFERIALTAEPSVIARAACKALGIEVE